MAISQQWELIPIIKTHQWVHLRWSTQLITYLQALNCLEGVYSLENRKYTTNSQLQLLLLSLIGRVIVFRNLWFLTRRIQITVEVCKFHRWEKWHGVQWIYLIIGVISSLYFWGISPIEIMMSIILLETLLRKSGLLFKLINSKNLMIIYLLKMRVHSWGIGFIRMQGLINSYLHQ